MTATLMPCPFCGGTPYNDEQTFHVFGTRTGHAWAVACSYCEVSAPGSNTIEDAIAAWNRRADLTPTLAAALALPEIAALVEAANAVLHDVRDLIANSEGVSGLHMNGDVADWESLLAGGAFEAWLRSVEPFATALAALTPPATQETP